MSEWIPSGGSSFLRKGIWSVGFKLRTVPGGNISLRSCVTHKNLLERTFPRTWTGQRNQEKIDENNMTSRTAMLKTLVMLASMMKLDLSPGRPTTAKVKLSVEIIRIIDKWYLTHSQWQGQRFFTTKLPTVGSANWHFTAITSLKYRSWWLHIHIICMRICFILCKLIIVCKMSTLLLEFSTFAFTPVRLFTV